MAAQQKKSSGGGLITFFIAAGVVAATAVPDLGVMPVVIVVLLVVILGFARAAVGGKKKRARPIPRQGGSPAGQTPQRQLGQAQGFGQYQSSGTHPSSEQPFSPGRPATSTGGSTEYATTLSQNAQERLKSEIRNRLASTNAGRQALNEFDAAQERAGQRVITRKAPNAQTPRQGPRPSTRSSTAQPTRPQPRPTSTPQAPPVPPRQTARRAPGSEIDLEDVDLADAAPRLRPGADINLHDVHAAPVGDDLNLPARSRARRPGPTSAAIGSLTGSSAISDAAASSLLGSALSTSSLFSSGTGSSLTLTSLTHLHDAD